ncbi:MAG: acyltransferase [Patescibacteria group bacterium]|nr:acyltransferase [Patescibacteria group bacterium]
MKIPYQNFWGKQTIGQGSTFGAFVDIGDGVVIGSNCKIECFVSIPPGVTLEDDVFVGPQACFTNDKHPRARGEWKMSKTLVKQGASIGANATILPGIVIGRNATIGSGSVVTKDVPDNETWAGNPAKKI